MKVTKTYSIESKLFDKFDEICKRKNLNRSQWMEDKIRDFISKEMVIDPGIYYKLRWDTEDNYLTVTRREDNFVVMSNGNKIDIFDFEKMYEESDPYVKKVVESLRGPENAEVEAVDPENFLNCGFADPMLIEKAFMNLKAPVGGFPDFKSFADGSGSGDDSTIRRVYERIPTFSSDIKRPGENVKLDDADWKPFLEKSLEDNPHISSASCDVLHRTRGADGKGFDEEYFVKLDEEYFAKEKEKKKIASVNTVEHARPDTDKDERYGKEKKRKIIEGWVDDSIDIIKGKAETILRYMSNGCDTFVGMVKDIELGEFLEKSDTGSPWARNPLKKISFIEEGQDSVSILESMIPMMENRALFWLNSDYSKDTNLMKELNAILSADAGHVILLDNAEKFFEKDNGWLDIEDITTFVHEKASHSLFESKYIFDDMGSVIACFEKQTCSYGLYEKPYVRVPKIKVGDTVSLDGEGRYVVHSRSNKTGIKIIEIGGEEKILIEDPCRLAVIGVGLPAPDLKGPLPSPTEPKINKGQVVTLDGGKDLYFVVHKYESGSVNIIKVDGDGDDELQIDNLCRLKIAKLPTNVCG